MKKFVVVLLLLVNVIIWGVIFVGNIGWGKSQNLHGRVQPASEASGLITSLIRPPARVYSQSPSVSVSTPTEQTPVLGTLISQPTLQPTSVATPTNLPTPVIGVAQQVFNQMADEEKVGQLLLVGSRATDVRDLQQQVQNLHAGAIYIWPQNVNTESALRAYIQKASTSAKVPLLVAVDWEGSQENDYFYALRPLYGDLTSFGKLGGQSVEVTTNQAQWMAEKLSGLGINLLFSPVLDVDQGNPIIGDRSFGSNSQVVSEHGVAFLEGFGGSSIALVGKHFPGHGAGDIDTHQDRMFLDKSREELKGLDVVPFKGAIAAGLQGLMPAHVVYTKIDLQNPATYSTVLIDEWLRQELGFDGICVTDYLGMKAITNYDTIPDAAIKSVSAGCDLVNYPKGGDSVSDAIFQKILQKYQSDSDFAQKVNQAVMRLLNLKMQLGLLNTVVASSNEVLIAVAKSGHSVPFFNQKDPFFGEDVNAVGCGPMVAAMVLAAKGIIEPTREAALALAQESYGKEWSRIKWSNTGLIADLLTRYGLKAVSRGGVTWAELQIEVQKAPVIISTHVEADPSRAAHLVVVLDMGEDYIVVNDPFSPNGDEGFQRKFSREEFERAFSSSKNHRAIVQEVSKEV